VAAPAGCSLFHAVSTWAETTTPLTLIDYLPAVSLFQDFRELVSPISYRRFRPRAAQLEARTIFVRKSRNRATAADFKNKTKELPVSTCFETA
jgi:hypothetical protein